MKLENNLLLEVANGRSTDRTPVWLMRQAGRVLPQYRAIKERIPSFKDRMSNPELACEITLQPIREFKVDAAIIFSDILVIPKAMHLDFEMIVEKGPFFPKTVQTEKDFEQLEIVTDLSGINYTIEAIRLVRKELGRKLPLIGFAGCPWTIFAYMTEGQGSKTFSKSKKLLYTNPTLSHQLLDAITQSTIFYLKEQIKAGVDIVQIFDSHAGILTKKQFLEFGLPYIKQICDAISEVPITVFAKGAWFALTEIAELDCQVIGLDWNMDPKQSRAIIGNNKALQGNMDSCLLYADTKTIEKETIKMLQEFDHHGHIANLGHGLYPDTPLDNIKCFVDTVKAYNYSQHAQLK